MAAKHKGLGRGLDALLAGNSSEPQRQDTLRVDYLQPGKYQPRTHMDQESLNELAASIKAQGVMQPILVRPVDGGRYEIIAGERRWRASQLAGLHEVPVLVRDIPDDSALAMSLIENIQREDLNPLEEAMGIQRLIDEFGMTHQQAADSVGRSRPAASNLLVPSGTVVAFAGDTAPAGPRTRCAPQSRCLPRSASRAAATRFR